MSDLDTLTIGGGFYGLFLSEHVARKGSRVVCCEQDPDLLGRASFNNQARVHNGYHYPRSLVTALRSRINFPRFVREFEACVAPAGPTYYAVARSLSKVSATQFARFMREVGAPAERAPAAVRKLFDPVHVEDVFCAVERVFDAAKLRTIMRERCAAAGVDLRVRARVLRVAPRQDGLIEADVERPSGVERLVARQVLLCGYSSTNEVLRRSDLPPLPLKHELAEMALVELPPALRELSVTVMCGPFFSFLPFPSRPGVHTLSHVRYTPHLAWQDGPQTGAPPPPPTRASAFPHMVADARRYVPLLEGARQVGSLWESKTVLPVSEVDDSRPILFSRDHGGVRGLHAVIGGKIDNVYDAVDALEGLPAAQVAARAAQVPV